MPNIGLKEVAINQAQNALLKDPENDRLLSNLEMMRNAVD